MTGQLSVLPGWKSSRPRPDQTHQRLSGSDQPGREISFGWSESAGLFLQKYILT